MQRLTFDGNFCDIAMCAEIPCKYPDCGCTQKRVWERLKAYEETGLKPDEIVELKNSVEEIRKEVDGLYEKQEFVQFLKSKGVDVDAGIQHMQDLLDAEEQGRLVQLPCKVGDTVWFKPDTCNPRKMRVQGISLSASCTDTIIHFGGYPVLNVWGSEFGKTVFLTREAAEAKMEGDNI